MGALYNFLPKEITEEEFSSTCVLLLDRVGFFLNKNFVVCNPY